MLSLWPFKKDSRPAKARKSKPARLLVEPLEDRNLMSWTTVPTAIFAPPAVSVQFSQNVAQGTAAITNNEIDYYTFLASKSGSHRFAADTPSSELNSILGVFKYDELTDDATQIAQNNDVAVGNTDSAAFATLVAGQRYYLGITNVTRTPNGSYNWSIIADDIYEQNDTLATARSLGTVTAKKTLTGLAAADTDYFKFALKGPATNANFVDIAFNNSLGNLDLRLLSTTGVELGNSQGTGDNERISLAGLAAGTYVVQVSGFQGAINPNYTLTINADDVFEENDTAATARNLGTLIGPRTLTDLSLGDAADWYKFTMNNAGTYDNNLELTFKNLSGNLDLALYNATGTTLLRSSIGSTDKESISLNGIAAGTYLVRVFPKTIGVTNSSYALSFTGNYFPDDSYENNDTIASASYLGYLQAPTTISNLAFGDSVDYFSFYNAYLGESSDFVSIQFDPAQGNLDLRLLDRNGLEIGSSLSSTAGEERVSLEGLGYDQFFVHVFSPDGSLVPNYSLTIDPGQDDRFEDNDVPSWASNLGTLTAPITLTGLRLLDAADHYSFTVPSGGTGSISAQIDFSNAQGDLDMYLVDPAGNIVDIADGTGDRELVWRSNMPAGTYQVSVSGKYIDGVPAKNPSYTLTINPSVSPADDAFDENDTLAQAADLGTLESPVTLTSLRLLDNDDWYKLTLRGPRTADASARVDFDAVEGNVYMQVVDANGKYVSSGSLGGLNGTYYIHVYTYSQKHNSDYTLTIDPGSFRDDIYEENDSLAQAFDLGLLTAPVNNVPLELNDGEDWFSFSTNSAGTRGYIELQYAANLALRLYDASGKELAVSADTHYSTQRIDFSKLSATPLAGTFYVRVSNADPAARQNYYLTINPPVQTDNLPLDDVYEENDGTQFGTFYFNLGTLTSPVTISELALLDGYDYYSFTMNQVGTSADYVEINFAHAQGDLSLNVSNSVDSVGYSFTQTDSERVSLAGWGPGTYYIQVSGWGGATNPSYTMTIHPGGSPAETTATTTSTLAEPTSSTTEESMASIIDALSTITTDAGTATTSTSEAPPPADESTSTTADTPVSDPVMAEAEPVSEPLSVETVDSYFALMADMDAFSSAGDGAL